MAYFTDSEEDSKDNNAWVGRVSKNGLFKVSDDLTKITTELSPSVEAVLDVGYCEHGSFLIKAALKEGDRTYHCGDVVAEKCRGEVLVEVSRGDDVWSGWFHEGCVDDLVCVMSTIAANHIEALDESREHRAASDRSEDMYQTMGALASVAVDIIKSW